MQYDLLKIASQQAADETQYDDTNRVEADRPNEIAEALREELDELAAEAEERRQRKAELQKAIERLQAARERLARKQRKKRLGMKRVRTKRLFKKRTNRTSRHWEKGNLFGL